MCKTGRSLVGSQKHYANMSHGFLCLGQTCQQGLLLFFFLLIRHPPSPPLFPYPPLSRSQERPPVLQVADLVHRRDAWVLELGGNPGLVGEPAGGCRAGGVPVPENLDRHVPVEGEVARSEEHTSELQSQSNLGCRLLLVKK